MKKCRKEKNYANCVKKYNVTQYNIFSYIQLYATFRCLLNDSKVSFFYLIKFQLRPCIKLFWFTKHLSEKFDSVTRDNKARLLTSFQKKFWKKFKKLSIITVNCKNFCKIFTLTKLIDFPYRLLLYFPNFQIDFLLNKKVILHELIKENGQVVWLIHGLNKVINSLWKIPFLKFHMNKLKNFL